MQKRRYQVDACNTTRDRVLLSRAKTWQFKEEERSRVRERCSTYRSARCKGSCPGRAFPGISEAGPIPRNHKILDFAYCLAHWENNEIHVLHVRPTGEERLPRQPTGAGQNTCQMLPLESSARDHTRLDSRRAKYGPMNRTMHFYYLRGEPASLICRLAQDRQIDLIVMGGAYRPGTTECVLDDVAET